MMLKLARRALRAGLGWMGYDVVRRTEQRSLPEVSFACSDLLEQHRRTAHIPGMISLPSAELLYAICVTQGVEGDVVEIGSWQGKSTSYLARAVRDSGNGHVFAIDHFKGNEGRESLYSVGAGIGNLQAQFEENMRSLGLDTFVTTIPHSSGDAYSRVSSRRIRFLFVDGDHTESGVARDIALFCPLVCAGGIVVFDDFDVTFPGVVRSAEKWINERRLRSVFVRDNMLVCHLR